MTSRFNKSGGNNRWAVVFTVIAVMALIGLGSGIVSAYHQRKALDQKMAELQAQIDKLNSDKRDFVAAIESYQSQFFLEQAARTKFNLKKPGEKVAVISLSGTPINADSADKATDGKSGVGIFSNVAAWWSFFF